MKYFFEDIENQKKLKKILDEWVGTPWRHRCGVKGKGADCIHFVARVLEELGLLIWRDGLIPDYAPDWHLHNTRELLKDALEKEVRGEWVNIENPMNGDILLSHYAKAASHAGFYFDGYVYQAIRLRNKGGVFKITINDLYFKRNIKFNYRVFP